MDEDSERARFDYRIGVAPMAKPLRKGLTVFSYRP